MQKKHLYKHKVSPRWSDFDSFGHINNATYLTYLEDARFHYLREVLHWDFRESGMVIAKATVDYLIPIEYEAVPVVNIYCTRTGNTSFDFSYDVCDQHDEDKVYARGLTVIVCIDMQTGRPVPIPAAYKEQIQP